MGALDESYWGRWSGHRVSRRTAIGAVGSGSIGAAGLLLAGCGSNGTKASASPTTSSTAQASGQPVHGGAWHYYADQITEQLNPATSVYAAAGFWRYIGDLAIGLDPVRNTLVPTGLAASWEQPAHDQITLKIRNAKWHNKPPVNGRAVTAEDIATSLLDHAGKLNTAGAKVVYPRAGEFSLVSTITAPDPETVVIKTSAPTNSQIQVLADWRLPMFPKEQLDIGFANNNNLIGSGPWVDTPGFTDPTDPNSDSTLTRNSEYWMTGHPYIETVHSHMNQDQAAVTSAFVANEINVLSTFRTPYAELQALIKRANNAQFRDWRFADWFYSAFNTKAKPWNDSRARRAIFLAINHSALGTAFYGPKDWQYTGPLPYTFFDYAIPPDQIAKMPGWDPSTKTKDIAEAKKLMSAALGSSKVDILYLNFALPMEQSNATLVQAHLQSAFDNVSVKLNMQADAAAFYAASAKTTGWDLQGNSIFPDPAPVTTLIDSFSTSGGRNYGFYSNPSVDTALQKALAEFDDSALKSQLLDIQKTLISEMPVMTHYAGDLSSMYSKNVEGLDKALGPGTSQEDMRYLWFKTSA